MENEKLATELLYELKASAKRWFIAFIVVLILWFSTIAIFIWYVSLPVEEVYYSQDADTDNNSKSIQIIDGDNYGTSETN